MIKLIKSIVLKYLVLAVKNICVESFHYERSEVKLTTAASA